MSPVQAHSSYNRSCPSFGNRTQPNPLLPCSRELPINIHTPNTNGRFGWTYTNIKHQTSNILITAYPKLQPLKQAFASLHDIQHGSPKSSSNQPVLASNPKVLIKVCEWRWSVNVQARKHTKANLFDCLRLAADS